MIRKNHTGFSLIEMLIVIVILGIVVGVGVPGYREYVQRANRADATTALLRIAAAQERFYIQNGTYADDLAADLGIGSTERNYYTLNVQPRNGGYANGYETQAAINPAEAQHDDEECAVFIMRENGQRLSASGGGGDTTATCWR